MVTDTPPRVTYNCNGSLTEFDFDFPVFQSSDLKITILNTVTNVATVLTEVTDYTVSDPAGLEDSSADYSQGGKVTTTVFPAYSSTYKITIERSIPYTQETDFTENMATLYNTFERGLDRLTMILQQVKDIIVRSPYCPSDDPTGLEMVMPNATDRAGRTLAFDDDGKPMAVQIASTDLEVTAFGSSLITQSSATGAQSVMGIDELAASLQAAIDAVEAMPSLGSVGDIRFSLSPTPRDNEIKLNGATLDRGDYPELWAWAGTNSLTIADASWSTNFGLFSQGNGTTTFKVPDFRAMFPRVIDDSRGVDTGRVHGAFQDSANLQHNHSHSHTLALYTLYGAGTTNLAGTGTSGYGGGTAGTSTDATNSGGAEARPKNVTVYAFIRFE